MNHNEIRFRILNELYNRYYNKELENLQRTDEVIEAAGISDLKDDAIGDIIFLENEYLIDDAKATPLGYVYPPFIRITSTGIKTVESILDQTIETAKNQVPDNMKAELEEVDKIRSPRERYREMLELVKLHIDTYAPIINGFLRAALG